MSNPENNLEGGNDKGEEKFDPADPWDNRLVDIGKNLGIDPDVKKSMTDEEFFDLGINFVSGRQYEDGFGAFNPGQGDWVVDVPEKIADFDEGLVNGTYRVQLDFAAVGQPDGPGTPGHIWAVRLFDRKEGKEISNSRVFADKLSHGATASLEFMPKYGKEKWQSREEWQSSFENSADAFDFQWANSEKSEHKEEIQSILKLKFPFAQKFIEAGGAKEWIKKRLEEEIPIREIISLSGKIDDFCNITYSLVEYFKNPKSWREVYPNDEIFRQGLISSEGDGWLPPPQWK